MSSPDTIEWMWDIPDMPPELLDSVDDNPTDQELINTISETTSRIISGGTRENVADLQELLSNKYNYLDRKAAYDMQYSGVRAVFALLQAAADKYCQLVRSVIAPMRLTEEIIKENAMNELIRDQRKTLIEKMQLLGIELGKMAYARNNSLNIYGNAAVYKHRAERQGDTAAQCAYDATMVVADKMRFQEMYYRRGEKMRRFYLPHPRYGAVIESMRNDLDYDASEVDPDILWELWERGAIYPLAEKPYRYSLGDALNRNRFRSREY